MAKVICDLTPDQKKDLLGEVVASLNDLIKAKQPFEINAFIKDIHDFVGSVAGPELALAYAALVPTNLRLSLVDEEISDFIGDNFAQIKNLEKDFKDVDKVIKFLGVAPEEETEAGIIASNEETAERDAYDEFLKSKRSLPRLVVFSARPNTLQSTTGESRVQGRGFSYGFLQHLSKTLSEDFDTSTSTVSEDTGFHVTAARAEDVLRPEDDPSGSLLSGVVQIVTDAKGHVLYFDNEYNLVSADQGMPVFFRFRENIDTVQTVQEISRTLGISEDDAAYGLDKQLIDLRRKKDFILGGNNRKVVQQITTFSLGFIDLNYEKRNQLSKVTDQDLTKYPIEYVTTTAFKEGKEVDVQEYMFLRGSHKSPVSFRMNNVDSDMEFVKDSAEIIFGNVKDEKGNSDVDNQLLIKNRKRFLYTFFGQNSSIKIVNGVAMVNDQPASVDDIVKALTQRVVKKGIIPHTLNYFHDHAQGVPFYSKNSDGELTLMSVGMNAKAYRGFVKDHSYTFMEITDDGQLKEENGYLVFEPTESEREKYTNPLELIEEVTETPEEDTLEVYQGYNTLDERDVNYFTVDKEEAKNYGKNVRAVKINTKNLLKGNSKEYSNLVKEDEKNTGIRFDILDNTKEGLEKQNQFFEFLKSKGYSGIDFTMYSDTQYIVTFGKKNFTETTTKPTVQVTGFQGYKSGFENKGKGTPEGDGKDKAMRKAADAFIGETSDIEKPSSTLTSHRGINKDVAVDDENGVLGYNYERHTAKVVMLARNGSLKGKPLKAETKQYIDEAFADGAEFVVGDMPGVDRQFIDYLQEIGAKFTIYHTGDKSRIQVTQPTTQPTAEGKPTIAPPKGFSIDDYLERFKLTGQKTDLKELTPEQIARVEKWFASSPISKHVTLNTLFNVLNSKSVGRFVLTPTAAAIYLYKGSDYTDLYHEAWHAFTSMFITEERAKEIFEIAKKLDGSFTNAQGKSVKFSEATFEEIDEYLAEDFRKFMVEQDNKVENPNRNSKIKSFFQSILDILKALFNLDIEDTVNPLTPSMQLQQIYQDLRVGDIAPVPVRYSKNIKTFDKIKTLPQNRDMFDEDLGYTNSIKVVKSMDAILSSITDELDRRKASTKRYSSSIMSNPESRVYAYNMVLGALVKRSQELRNELEKTPGEKEVVLEIVKTGKKIISSKDIANYNKVNAYRKSTEFFTPETLFTEFYDNQTGKKNTAPQSSSWILNDRGYYDLIDKETGEVYIDNVDLSTGVKMIIEKQTKKTLSQEYSDLYNAYTSIDYAIRNFAPGSTAGEPITLDSLQQAIESGNGTIAFHLQKSKYITLEEKYDALNTSDDEAGRSDFRDRAGNEMSAKDLASKELMYVFRGLFQYDGKNVVMNDYGFPEIIDFDIAWSKVLKTIGQLKSPRQMYDALVKKAATDPVINQFLSKVGDPNPVAEGTDITIRQLNLWTDIFNVFSMPRIPLRHLTLKLKEDPNGEITDLAISSGRAEADTRTVKNDWNAQFQSSTNNNPYVVKRVDTGVDIGERAFKGNYLNVRKIVDDFKTRHKTDPVAFLRAIGMLVSGAEEIEIALSSANKGKLRLFPTVMYKKLLDISNRNSQLDTNSRIYINKPSDLAEYKLDNKNDTGAYEELLAMETRYSDKYGTAVVYNAARDLQWEYSLPSTLSKRIGYLNAAKSYGNLIQDPRTRDWDTKRNPFAKNLMILRALFGDNYDTYTDDTKLSEVGPRQSVIQKGGRKKTSQLILENSAGISISINDEYTNLGIKSFNADESSSILENFFKRIKGGLSEGTRHSDKTTTYLSHLVFADGRRDYIDVSSFAAFNTMSGDVFDTIRDTPGVDIALQQFKYYLESEVARMYRLRNDDPTGEFSTGKKLYKDVGKDFHIFQDILRPDTKKKIEEKHLGENLLESIMTDVALMDAIDDDILDYFSSQVSAFKEDLINTGIENNPLLLQALRDDIISTQDVTEAVAASNDHMNEALYWAFVLNDWIHKHETTVLFYGDPALFEDLHKRNGGVGGTGTIPRTDAEMISILNNLFPKKYVSSKWFKNSGMEKAENAESPWDITYNSAVLDDTSIDSPYHDYYVSLAIAKEKERKKVDSLTSEEEEIIRSRYKAYKGMEIGDGQGWVSFDAYRNLSIRMGRWSDYQNTLYTKIMMGMDVSEDKITRYFPILKMQYWGQLDLEEGLPATAFHKYSLAPLVPNIIAGTKLEILHNRMASQGIDYAMFKSASKMATVTTNGKVDSFYTDKKQIGPVAFADNGYKFTVNKIFIDYFKNQQETNDAFKGYIPFSTQLRTIIEMGSMEQGFPVDYNKNQSDENRRESWNKLTEAQKVKESPIYAKIKNYRRAVENLSNYKKIELLQEAGVEVDSEGNYTVSDKLINFIQKQLTAREVLGEHEIEFMGDISDFSIHPNAAQIEKLIMAIVHKRLIKQHVNGESLVQVSTAGFESKNFQGAGLRNATDEENRIYGSTDLDFYTPGKAMKVKIAMQGPYKVLLEQGDVKKRAKEKGISRLAALNQLIKEDSWLKDNRKLISLVGVRIPVQGLNSVEWAEVYEFLPENAGNMVIVPAEIVAKSGSDFDIDKLFMMFPSLVKIGNKVQLAEYSAEAESKIKANKALIRDLYDYVDSLFDKVNDLTTATDREGRTVDAQDAIYKGILKYKAEKEAIKEKIYGENPEDNPEILEELHEELHDLKKHLAKLYDMSKGLSAEIDKIFKEEINPTFEEIDRVKADIMAASSKGLENDLMMAVIDLISMPENFVEFITPNGTYYARPIAESISDYVTDYDPYASVTLKDNKPFIGKNGKKAIAGTRVYELRFNRGKQSSNNIGKMSLGMAAVQNKYHPIKNGVGAYLNPVARIYGYSYPDNLDDYYDIVQTLRMPHNTLSVNGEDAISLSHDYDVNNLFKISDTNSQFINGFVDVAKDDWIFWIQGNKEVTPVLQFLVDAGVDLRQAAYFVSQPIIRDYVDQQRRIKGTFARALKVDGANSNNFRNIARFNILNNLNRDGAPFKPIPDLEVSDITKKLHTEISPMILGTEYDDIEVFNTNTLLRHLRETSDDRKAGIKTPYTEFDYKVFVHFLEAEEMSKADTKIKMATNFDTQKMSSLFELISKVNNFQAALSDPKMTTSLAYQIMEMSPIGAFKADDVILSVFGSLFELRTHPVFLNMVSGQESKMTDYKLDKTFPGAFKSKEDFIEALRNDFVVYAFQEWLYDANRLKTRSMYKGMSIKPMNLNIRRLAKLDHGAFVSDGVLYIDPERLEQDVISGDYASRKVYAKQRKLAPIPKDTFANADPEISKAAYNRFVFERETIRYMYPFEEYASTKDYRQRVRQLSEFSKDIQGLGMKVEEMAYELFLRDTALMNTLNIEFMFRNPEGYATQVEKIYSAYPELSVKYPILNALNTPKNRDTKNIALAEATPDPDTINSYNEQLERLSDPNVKKTDNELDNLIISNVFAKFALFALNQSGLNAKGQYNITRLSTSGMKVMMEEAKAKALRMLNNKKASPGYLKRYMNLFTAQYQAGVSETEEPIPYRAKRVKDFHNNFMEEVKAPNYLLIKTIYNPAVTVFRNDIKTASFIKAVSADTNDVNTYIGESSLSPANQENSAILGDSWNNAVFQDMVANKQITADKALLIPTKKVALALSQDDFLTDDTYEDNIQKIEAVLQEMKRRQDKGKALMFSARGYGMALLGYGGNENIKDPANKVFKPTKKYKDGIPARKTFVYLSQRLLDLFGYKNPMYDQMKEEYAENVIEKQPFTDADVARTRRECFKSLYNND